MLARNLELSINKRFQYVKDRRHEFITIEDLALSLLEDAYVLKILNTLNVNPASFKQKLIAHIRENVPILSDDSKKETQPTLGFQRCLQRAVLHVQSSGNKDVESANVFIALFGERESYLYGLMEEFGLTREGFIDLFVRGDVADSTDEADSLDQNGLLENINIDISPVLIFVDPGSASARELAELFAEISILYRMVGGSGLCFEHLESKESQEIYA